MDMILECDTQEGRTMGWHNKTKINPELSLANNHLRGYEFVSKPVMTIDGQKLPLCVLGVSDDAQMNVLDDNGEPTRNDAANYWQGVQSPHVQANFERQAFGFTRKSN